jgi:hypothetical protein
VSQAQVWQQIQEENKKILERASVPYKVEPESPAPIEGRKEDQGKLRFDLLPVKPLEEVAYVYTAGAKKYDDRNWEKGLKWGRVFGAMMRHAWAFWKGESRHEEAMHHLASVVWCALALMEYETTHPELDDRPGRGGLHVRFLPRQEGRTYQQSPCQGSTIDRSLGQVSSVRENISPAVQEDREAQEVPF